MLLSEYPTPELIQLHGRLRKQYDQLKRSDVSLNLTRGIPSSEQVALSERLDGILNGDYQSLSGVDTRNYGGLDGLKEAKCLFAPMLGVSPDDMLVAGNSSLALMFEYLNFAHFIGASGPGSAWSLLDRPRFICPTPGYDRHFYICEHLGIEMLPVPMLDDGPDMQKVTELVESVPNIVGIWCVPKYSNPTGVCYNAKVVNQLAELPRLAGNTFRIMWDNAYSMHDLESEAQVNSLLVEARVSDTQDAVIAFGSSSKISLPGAAVAFMAASRKNLHAFKQHLQIITIGPDKVNQLRHVKFFRNIDGIRQHMTKHAQILRPKFRLVQDKLSSINGLGVGEWSHPKGGYFVSFDTLPGLAKTVVKLCTELGLALTPAGVTFPYGIDPDDRNIRIAPSFPVLKDLETAMDAFICSVKLATVEQLLKIRGLDAHPIRA